MSDRVKPAKASDESALSTRTKLAALWVVLVLLYLYADVLSLFRPGELAAMMEGRMGPVEATQASLFLAAAIVTIPALMVFLTLAIPAPLSRGASVVLGVAYAAVSAGNLIGETWAYYLLFGALEVVVAVLIVRHAWNWQPGG